MSVYQVGILGNASGRDAGLSAAVAARLAELGIDAASLAFIPESEVPRRDRKKPFIGVFFGYPGASDANHLILNDLLADSVVIVPALEDLGSFSKEIPECLRHINGLALPPGGAPLARLVTVLLENFRLLRTERRLFISYKRAESGSIAIQLYEKLEAAGFDVFLDTHSVPPAADFQSVLWHRLADSDVVVLLDTPGFRSSRWTREELAQANATSVQILHLLWPTAPVDKTSAFSEFLSLLETDFESSDLVGDKARLSPGKIKDIVAAAESLRARALSARHRYLVDNFCDQARASGHKAIVQPTRFIALELTDDRSIAVVPAVGVPSATRYQEIEQAISGSETAFEKVWLLYDERGVLKQWLGHIDWLNEHLPLTAVRVSDATTRIKALTP